LRYTMRNDQQADKAPRQRLIFLYSFAFCLIFLMIFLILFIVINKLVQVQVFSDGNLIAAGAAFGVLTANLLRQSPMINDR
jgi:hypothetical protein